MPIWTGRDGSCVWSYHSGKPTSVEWDAFVDFLRREHTSGSPPATGLTVTYEVSPPTATERKRLSDLLRSGAADSLRAHAFVTDSRILQGVLTALDWIVKKPYKESVFTETRKAVRWLESFHRDVHAAAIVSAIIARVPAEVLAPDLAAKRTSAGSRS